MAEEQLDFIGRGHRRGGARAGAGRPKTRLKKPVVMRVPAEYEQAVRDLIAFIDSAADVEKGNTIQTDPKLIHTDTAELAGGTVHLSFKAFKST